GHRWFPHRDHPVARRGSSDADGGHHLAWSHDFNDDGPEFRAKFADGPIFQVAGANIGQDALLTGLGVNIQANDRTNVEVGYA
ncbi:autotransporter domain-containing protein, partial [Escherichia coli]|nr:autotransporter domain-containing protein [Escherichia coli]